jgi:RNA polymerase sigma-70 factor (ECF subfamily)
MGGYGAAAPPRPGEARSLEADSDDALLGRINRGDQTAWRVLVDRHLPPLHGYAWYMLRDNAEAEDVAQEAFLRLMKKAADWQPGGAKLRTWLYRVAINLCIDRRRAPRPAALDDGFDSADPESGEASMVRGMDLARHVRVALDGLNERQRSAIVLVHYQGYSNAETAALMEISVEAVESLLARGRRRLRGVLAPVADDLLGEHR